jgi:chorismate mutase
VGATGLAATPTEYLERLRQQTDEQLDAWAAELLRDVAKRRGLAKVVADFRKTAHLDEKAFRRVFARGGGAPQTVGTDAAGRLMVPSISLHFLVPGLRAEVSDARVRLIAYLVACFDEIVYV